MCVSRHDIAFQAMNESDTADLSHFFMAIRPGSRELDKIPYQKEKSLILNDLLLKHNNGKYLVVISEDKRQLPWAIFLAVGLFLINQSVYFRLQSHCPNPNLTEHEKPDSTGVLNLRSKAIKTFFPGNPWYKHDLDELKFRLPDFDRRTRSHPEAVT